MASRVHKRVVFRYTTGILLCLFALSTSGAQSHALSQNPNNNAWSVQTAEKSQGGYPFTMKLDASGVPHMAAGGGRLYYASLSGGNWSVETVDSTPGAGNNVSLALDASGHPHIAYEVLGINSSGYYASSVRYAYWSGSQWTIQNITAESSSSGSVSSTPAIALDAAGRPQIVFRDQDYVIKSAKWTGNQWTYQTVDPTSSSTPNCQFIVPSLVFGNGDIPHVSYICNGLRHAWLNGSSWTVDVVDAAAQLGHTSLALDSSGHPHIAYDDFYANGVKYASWSGTAWSTGTIENVGWGSTPSLQIDASDVPHVAYTGNSRALRLATWNGATWSILSAPGVLDDGFGNALALDSSQKAHLVYGTWPPEQIFYVHEGAAPGSWTAPQLIQGPTWLGRMASLAVDQQNHPHISYLDYAQRTLRYATWNGSQWSSQFVDNAGDWHLYSSIKTDSSNHPHIAYFATNALKYASWDGALWNITSVAGETGRYDSLALDHTDHDYPRIAYCTGAGTLRYASWNGSIWNIQTLDSVCGGYDTGGETSLVLDSAGHPHIAYHSNGGASYTVRYIAWDGTQWSSPSVVSPDGYGGSLALDSSGMPHIAFCGIGNFQAQYASWNGSSWDVMAIENPNPANWKCTAQVSLAIDGGDVPHVAYTESMTNDIRSDSWNGSAWVGEVVDPKVNWTGMSYTAIAMGPNGVPWVAYPNENSGDVMAAARTGTDVSIGGTVQGTYGLQPGSSTRVSFGGLNNGPVKISSGVPNIAAERVIYNVNGSPTSFSEMMALPNSQLDTSYWLPWYNNVDLDTQLRFANVSGATTSVHVFINGTEMTAGGSPFTLLPGASTRASFPGINNGPVEITTDHNIVAAERVIYKINGVNTSFSEMMALPNGRLDKSYWLPWYNNVDLDSQLRFANVSGATTSVHVFINGTEMTAGGSPFTLLPGASTRVSFPGINNGPVQITTDHNIVASERVIYNVNGKPTSYSEMMALPNSQLDTSYWMPWYNNVDLDTQLRFGNVSGLSNQVHVYIGGLQMTGSPFTLGVNGSTRISFAGINSGLVRVTADHPIVAAERVIYKVNGTNTSFSEMMALPNSQLDTTYWLPWYNNIDLDTQLRFGMP